jgi:hypothetical protein
MENFVFFFNSTQFTCHIPLQSYANWISASISRQYRCPEKVYHTLPGLKFNNTLYKQYGQFCWFFFSILHSRPVTCYCNPMSIGYQHPLAGSIGVQKKSIIHYLVSSLTTPFTSSMNNFVDFILFFFSILHSRPVTCYCNPMSIGYQHPLNGIIGVQIKYIVHYPVLSLIGPLCKHYDKFCCCFQFYPVELLNVIAFLWQFNCIIN